jgi:hypothetical protein
MTDVATRIELGAPVLAEPGTNGTSYYNLLVDDVKQFARPKEQLSATKTSTYNPMQSYIVRGSANAVPESIAMNWNRIANSKISKQTYSKLLRFANRPDGWRGPGSLKLSPSSINAFLDFWQKIREVAHEPSIALTAAGGLQAQWYKSDKEHLDLVFRPDRKIYFGLFRKGAVYEGIDDLDSVVQFVLADLGQPLSWKD